MKTMQDANETDFIQDAKILDFNNSPQYPMFRGSLHRGHDQLHVASWFCLIDSGKVSFIVFREIEITIMAYPFQIWVIFVQDIAKIFGYISLAIETEYDTDPWLNDDAPWTTTANLMHMECC